MRIASVTDIKAKFSAYLKASQHGPVVVTKNGKPVAVLLSMEDEDELERIIFAYSPQVQGILRKAEQQIEAGQGFSHEDFWGSIETNEAIEEPPA